MPSRRSAKSILFTCRVSALMKYTVRYQRPILAFAQMATRPLLCLGNGNANGFTLVHSLVQQRIGDLDRLPAQDRRKVFHRSRVVGRIPRHDRCLYAPSGYGRHGSGSGSIHDGRRCTAADRADRYTQRRPPCAPISDRETSSSEPDYFRGARGRLRGAFLSAALGRFRVASLTATRARFRRASLIAFSALVTALSTSLAASRAACAAFVASLMADISTSSAARAIVSAAALVCLAPDRATFRTAFPVARAAATG